jgi:hypothetical protein
VNAAPPDAPHIDRASTEFPVPVSTGTVMTRPDQAISFPAAMFALAAIFLLAPAAVSSPALAASGVPPFCVTRGGADGAIGPQDCRYYDYQSCIQAAISRGNCVQNIDYHGEVSTTAAPARPRHRR